MRDNRRSPLRRWAAGLLSACLLASLVACSLPFTGRHFQPTDLGDRVVLALVALPDGTLLAGTSDGLWRAPRAGDAWVSAAGLPAETVVPGLAASGAAAYAATSRGAYRSDDGGASWVPLGGGLPLAKGPLLSITPATASGRRLVVGTARDGIFGSDDGGATWRDSSVGLPPSTGVYTVVAEPAPVSRLWAGTLGAGLVRSDDDGQSWRAADGFPPGANVFAIGVGAGGLRLVGTSVGLFRSEDGGQRWEWVRGSFTKSRVVSLARGPADRWLAGADNGVWESSDGGRQWQRLATGLPEGEHVAAVVVAGGRAIAAAGQAYQTDWP